MPCETLGVRASMGTGFSGTVETSAFTVFFHVLICGIVLVALLLSMDTLPEKSHHQGEYYALIVFGAGRGLALGPGALVVLGASLCASLYNVLQKRNMGRYAPLEFTTYVIWAGTLPLLVYLPGLVGAVRSAPLGATGAVVYLGIFPGAIAYALWVYALSRLSASVLSSWLYLNPVLAIAIAWIWLGEIPTALSLLGGAVAVGGVMLVAFFGRRLGPGVVPEGR